MAVLCLALASGAGTARAATIRTVPTQYATIQAAVDASAPGDTIKVKPGTYTEQVSIGKDLTITGASAAATTVSAPSVLVPGAVGKNAIVDVHSGARVTMSRIGVSGPTGSCGSSASLFAGIMVVEDANLDLSDARVTNIRNQPVEACEHDGNAVVVGSFIPEASGNATIRNVVISSYQSAGVLAFGPDTYVTVTQSTITGNASRATNTYGIEFGVGATVTATFNVISDNRCDNPDLPCGSDPFEEYQGAGIGNGPGDPGTGSEFAYNTIIGNDVGIYLFAADNCCSIHHNVLVNNRWFGVLVQDGVNEISENLIVGGQIGVGAVAGFFADAVATLHGDKIVGQSVARTKEIECCGFTATVVE